MVSCPGITRCGHAISPKGKRTIGGARAVRTVRQKCIRHVKRSCTRCWTSGALCADGTFTRMPSDFGPIKINLRGRPEFSSPNTEQNVRHGVHLTFTFHMSPLGALSTCGLAFMIREYNIFSLNVFIGLFPCSDRNDLCQSSRRTSASSIVSVCPVDTHSAQYHQPSALGRARKFPKSQNPETHC
jgi:hypothetical protein